MRSPSVDKRLSTLLRVNQIAVFSNPMWKERGRILNGRKFWNKLERKSKLRNTSGIKDLTTLKTDDGIVLIANILRYFRISKLRIKLENLKK